MSSEKRKKLLIIIGVSIVLLLVVGASYAYFHSQIDSGDKTPVDITTDTTDNLLFNVEDNINLAINKYNFGVGAGDLTSHAKATATLRANSTDNAATYRYQVYFNIESNQFVYTTTEHKPEIILTITDPTGNPVTSVEGLNYVTAGSVSGFDITTATGLFTIASNHEITSTSSTEDTVQEWNFTATFINLDSDQNDNTGKSMKGTIVIQRNPVNATLADVCATGNNLASCIMNLSGGDLIGEKTVYHHNGKILDDTGNVIDAGDGSYRFAGKAYKLAEGYKQVPDEIIKRNCNGSDIAYYNSCAEGNVEYFYLSYDEAKTQYPTKKAAFNQAKKDGYINFDIVKNYVCFGSDEEVCPQDNLYRIIGIFDNQIKLIKADIAGTDLLGEDGDYFSNDALLNWGLDDPALYLGNKEELTFYASWQINGGFTWDYSSALFPQMSLNKINLNTNFLNNIREKWSNLIVEKDWYTGYVPIELTINDKQVPIIYGGKLTDIYSYEVGSKADKEGIYRTKVGLMYLNEYGYACDQSEWKNGMGSCILGNNWIDIGTIERVLPTDVDYGSSSFIVQYGYADYDYYNFWTIRPTFYLNKNITYKSGIGTEDNPIRIEV